MIDIREIRHAHLFCGLGGGKKGFNRGQARVGNMVGVYRCIGGIDSVPACIHDFDNAGPGRGTVMDLFDRDQYTAWHGHEPPRDWHEATPADVVRAFGGERPHILFTSPPCKGFSGLLSSNRSVSDKYQALNRLTLRGIWLTLEAYKDDPIEFFLLENVPLIQSRGKHLLQQIRGLLEHYGYAVALTTHDCGELGGLGQSRKRFLLVARHQEKVPPFLYQPSKKPLLPVGRVLERFPLPGELTAGPLHRIPRLQWRTWVRLAFVEAGSDWRSLEKYVVENGVLRDFALVPELTPYHGVLGVTPWEGPASTVTSRGMPNNGTFAVADPRGETFKGGRGVLGWGETAGAVSGESLPSNGRYAVADPRFEGVHYSQYGVKAWEQAASTVTGQRAPGQGPISVADPRVGHGPNGPHFNNVYRVVRSDQPCPTVSAGHGPSAGGLAVAAPYPGQHPTYKQIKYKVTPWGEPAGAVIGSSSTGYSAFALADPRMKESQNRHFNQFKLVDWKQPAKTIIGATRPGSGALSVADPRTGLGGREAFNGSGHYGVVDWQATSSAVTGSTKHDSGIGNVADPRWDVALPAASDKVVCMIRALDGTWHRPFTTLELAALQGLVEPEEYLELHGTSDSAWRERIGNAVPPPAAEAIASIMGQTLLQAWSGETFLLSDTDIWVRDIAVALTLPGQVI